MKIENYRWNGFGFPIIFETLPAVKLRGELVPDVDFDIYAKPLIQFICAEQNFPMSGSQIKFIRHFFGMSLRDFAKFLNVKHQSVMRWEAKNQSAARIDVNMEIVIRLKILKTLKSDSSAIDHAVEKVNEVKEFELAGHYKQFKPIKVPAGVIQAAFPANL